MYLFMLCYPFLVLLFFLSCGLVRLKSVSMIAKMSGRVWVLIAAFLAIILRFDRSSLNEQVAWSALQNYFVSLCVITVIMFLIVFSMAQKHLRVLYNSKSDDTPALSAHARFRVSDEELIIVIALLNECIIVGLHILMNHTFFNWIDVIIVPLSRMSVVQVLIFVCVSIDTTIHRSNKNINTCMVFLGYGLILVVCTLLNGVTLVLMTQYKIFNGMILLGLSVSIGWGTAIYFYCNRKFDDNNTLVRVYK